MEFFYYNGLKKIYFQKIINEIINIASLRKTKKILDFGCGSKQLQKTLKKKIINYDKNKSISDYKDYKQLKFDVAVFNHVLMYMSESEINKTLRNLKIKNKQSKIVIGISRVNLISKIASFLTLSFFAHSNIVSKPSDQKKIIFKHLDLIRKKNIFFMTDIYYLKFK